MGSIVFQVQKGGLARTATNNDHISALVFSNAAPGAWNGAVAKKYTAITQAEADGITEVSANFAEHWYHLWCFFKMNPSGAVWLIMNSPNLSQTLVQQCQGEVRRIGAYITAVSQIGSVWQALANTLDGFYCQPQIVVGWNGATPIDPTTSDFNMQLKNSPNVSVLAAGDGGAKGLNIAQALGKSYLPAIGAVIGAKSRSNISNNIGWVEQYNFSDGSEFETIKLANNIVNPTSADITLFDNAKIMVFEKLINYGGTYLNDTYTAIVETDDFATIENNEVMQKCKRLVYAALLPQKNRPVKVDANSGKMEAGFVGFLEGVVETPLRAMQDAEEVSGFFVSIDPAQNVLSNSTIVIDVGITPIGVARNLIVKIGYRVRLDANF